ncbi:hypothetical protein ACFU8R_17905 [Pseudonocardia alni]|jgi:hypothetical protein|uniref:Lipoprotein n=1 Tax=Pseudonocardia alni TaxID=33907 RepID=A0A852WEJ2_PSEA5|nr:MULTISPECIES: hypothetical protein [Pseudonocardia]MYW73728.1 hypothetical protein [Pseudonocardia sp. SID8383]NYG03772.1 hypothetical protein [Pseudonocardia antarctica]
MTLLLCGAVLVPGLTGCAWPGSFGATPAPPAAAPAALPKYYDPAPLITDVRARTRLDGGSTLSVAGTLTDGGTTVPVTGDGALRVDQDGDAPAVRLLLRSGPSGAVAQSTEIIRIDGRTWLRPGEGGWGEAGRVSLPPEQMSHATLAANVAAGLDPLGAVARYPDAVLVADAADDAVDGTPTVHYTLVVDLVRAAATETDPARRTALQAQQQAGLTRLSAEIWVDAERRPLRSRVRQQLPDGAALDALVRYDGWGAPITIEPPVRG